MYSQILHEEINLISKYFFYVLPLYVGYICQKRQTTYIFKIIYKIGSIFFTHEYLQLAAKYRSCSWLHYLNCFFSHTQLQPHFFSREDKHSINCPLPTAPAARAAASGPASGASSGGGRSHMTGLASSRALTAPASALLTSRVGVSALVTQKLAG